MKNKMPIKIKGKIPVSFFKEGRMFVAYSIVLDLSTCGETFEEAKKNFMEALNIFFEECIKMGTLVEVLESYGWEKIGKSWQPPAYIGHEDLPIPLQQLHS
ncbi:MAG: type II toxin-antitoxin system HicB family antitoxin [bacterium]